MLVCGDFKLLNARIPFRTETKSISSTYCQLWRIMQSYIHWFLFGLYLAVMFDSAASGCETNKQIRTKHEHRQPRKFRHAHITIIYIVSATKEILIKWGKNSVVSGYGELLYKESWKIGKCLQLNGGMH